MHALIIEDEVLIGCLIEDGLCTLGFTSFDLAANEEQAIGYATVHCPDLITADQRLSGGSGVSAVLEICETTPIPVVFIVAESVDVSDRIPSAIILCKPFNRDGLKQAVREALASTHSNTVQLLERTGVGPAALEPLAA
jgi:DNA-binding response OmpR family regulator